MRALIGSEARDDVSKTTKKTADATRDLDYVKIAFESLGSFNWRPESSVKIEGRPTFFAIVNGTHYVWANAAGVILGGVGRTYGANVFEAVKYLRLTLMGA
jgi:hypothetical protein